MKTTQKPLNTSGIERPQSSWQETLIANPSTAHKQVTHELKAHPNEFQAIAQRVKNFEFRKDDREPRFEVGHILILREFLPWNGTYTGRKETRQVTYKLQTGFGLPAGFCILSLR